MTTHLADIVVPSGGQWRHLEELSVLVQRWHEKGEPHEKPGFFVLFGCAARSKKPLTNVGIGSLFRDTRKIFHELAADLVFLFTMHQFHQLQPKFLYLRQHLFQFIRLFNVFKFFDDFFSRADYSRRPLCSSLW